MLFGSAAALGVLAQSRVPRLALNYGQPRDGRKSVLLCLGLYASYILSAWWQFGLERKGKTGRADSRLLQRLYTELSTS